MNINSKNNNQGQVIKTALLIEDNKIIQQAHTFNLEKNGYQVDIASDGEEAIAKAVNPYELIFIDIGLPDLDGREVIEKISSLQKNRKQAPIIVLTAYSDSKLEEECLAAGAKVVFVKPISSEQFKQIIDKFTAKNEEK